MSTRKAPPKRRTTRYRFTTSMLFGVLVALVLMWAATVKRHAGLPAETMIIGGASLALVVGLAAFVAWTILAVARWARERGRHAERDQARQPRRRRSRYAHGGEW